MKKSCKTVDEYIEKLEGFEDVITKLREVFSSSALTEEVKWNAPAYTHNGKLVATLAAFQEHCAIWFHQGALMADAKGYFEDPEAVGSKAKAMRQWRLHSTKDIKVRDLKAYIKEAKALIDEGKSIKPQRGKPIAVPPELQAVLNKSAKTRKAFEALTPGKQRDYANHVAEAKKPETKQRRIEKITPMIQAGVGLHDKYRSC